MEIAFLNLAIRIFNVYMSVIDRRLLTHYDKEG
jgi:hypothetical protein